MTRTAAQTFGTVLIAGLLLGPAAVTAQAGLLGWWSFDNPDSASDTTFDDETGVNPEGSFNGTAGFTANGAGHSGNSGDYAATGFKTANGGTANVPDNDAGADDLDIGDRNFTISFWAKRGGQTTRIEGVIGDRGRRPGYTIFLDNSSIGLRLDDTNNNNVQVTTSLAGPNSWSHFTTDGDWHHYAWTVDKSSTTGGKVYVDGSFALNSGIDFTGIGDISNTNTDLRFGVFRGSKDEYFNGDLDDIAIFDRALGGNEVQSLADGVEPTAIPEPGSLALLAPAGMLMLRRRRR